MGAYPEQSEYSDPGISAIFVEKGTYSESLVLPPLINLFGSGAEETIIDANFNSNVITCFGGMDNNIIEGFTLQNGSSSGIYLKSSSPLIKSNIITGMGFTGIYSVSSSPKVINNTITLNSDGIKGLGKNKISHQSAV